MAFVDCLRKPVRAAVLFLVFSSTKTQENVKDSSTVDAKATRIILKLSMSASRPAPTFVGFQRTRVRAGDGTQGSTTTEEPDDVSDSTMEVVKAMQTIFRPLGNAEDDATKFCLAWLM
jgi:hypothetical protein